MKPSILFSFGFLLLSSLYFPLHHFVVNYLGVSLDDYIKLFFAHALTAAVSTALWWLVVKNWTLSAILTLPILIFFVFFGNFQDLLARLILLPVVIQYLILLSPLVLIVVIMKVWLKKNPVFGERLSWLFNLIFIAWMVVEIVNAFRVHSTFKSNQDRVDLKLSPHAWKPNIYLLVADEYPRADALQSLFNFDNSAFLNDLERRGFNVIDSSHSNYDITQFSMASMLNLNYLELSNSTPRNSDYSMAGWMIRSSPLWSFLRSNGYHIHNYSVFNVGEQAPSKNSYIRHYNREYFYRTFPGRLYKDLGMESSQDPLADHNYNHQTLNRLRQFRGKGKDFLYGHLLMPHFPHFLDSTGKLYPENQRLGRESFIPYLKYTNQQLLSVIDHVQKLPGEKIIVLLSDHGFREGETASHWFFKNFAAAYSSRPIKLPENLDNVNLFRMVLNAALDQELPLLEKKRVHLLTSDPLKQ